MYRSLSYVRQPRSTELRTDQQAVYQRAQDFWITDRWVTGVPGFYLIGTVHMGTFDAAVGRNTRFGVHRSIGHSLRPEGVQSGLVEVSSTTLLYYLWYIKNGQRLEFGFRILFESLPALRFEVRYYWK